MSVTYSEELSASFVRRVNLTETERNAFSGFVGQVQVDPYTDFESFYDEIKALRTRLPPRLLSELHNFRTADRGGVFLIDNIPIPSIPVTPRIPFTHAPITELRTEIALALISTVVAEPFTFTEWDGAHLIQNKYPLAAHRNIQFGTNAVDFRLHSDTPFREFSADYVGLLCLRGDPSRLARTTLCDLGAVIDSMSSLDIATLSAPLFAYETDNPAVVVNGRKLTPPMPIITTLETKRSYTYTHDVCAITDDAEHALARLKSRIEQEVHAFRFTAGMLLLIDNSHMIHGRTQYSPNYDGSDRWLQRILLTTRLYSDQPRVNVRHIPDRNLVNYPTAYQNVLQSLDPAAAQLPAAADA